MPRTRQRRRLTRQEQLEWLVVAVLGFNCAAFAFVLHRRKASAPQAQPTAPRAQPSDEPAWRWHDSPPPSPPPPPPWPSVSAPFVLVSFTNGNILGDGLRLLYSRDARTWLPLAGEPLVLPLKAAGGKVFRDPSVTWHAPTARFHLVYTTELCVGQLRGKWKCQQLKAAGRPMPRFGYATSRDLVTWEDIRQIDVPLKGACSLWAPEISVLPHDEGGGFMVSFSATSVPDGPCPVNFRKTAHRGWLVTSHDMVSFSKPKRVLSSVGDSIIDLFPLLSHGGEPSPRGGDPSARDAPGVAGAAPHPNPKAAPPRHLLIYKSEHNTCGLHRWSVGSEPRASDESCTLVLRQARAANATGPWLPDGCARGLYFPESISRACAEGPSALRLPSGDTIILFDGYRADCPLLAPAPCNVINGRPVSELGYRKVSLGRIANEVVAAGGKLADGERPDDDVPFETPCAYLPTRKGFGALLSRDLCTWEDISGSISVPIEYKHGTGLHLQGKALRQVCRNGPFANTSVCESL